MKRGWKEDKKRMKRGRKEDENEQAKNVKAGLGWSSVPDDIPL